MGLKTRRPALAPEHIDVLEQLRAVLGERLQRDGTRECMLAVEPPISVGALSQLEADIAWTFPEEYRRCVTELGFLYVNRWSDGYGPDVYDRMLRPDEIREIHSAFKTWVEDCEIHETPEEAEQQQSIRDTLVPFQFLGDCTAWDVACFVQTDSVDGELRVIGAYHDNDELDYLLGKQCQEERTHGFASHLRKWLAERQLGGVTSV